MTPLTASHAHQVTTPQISLQDMRLPACQEPRRESEAVLPGQTGLCTRFQTWQAGYYSCGTAPGLFVTLKQGTERFKTLKLTCSYQTLLPGCSLTLLWQTHHLLLQGGIGVSIEQDHPHPAITVGKAGTHFHPAHGHSHSGGCFVPGSLHHHLAAVATSESWRQRHTPHQRWDFGQGIKSKKHDHNHGSLQTLLKPVYSA